jgi:protein kinase-like protein/3-keto-disaccharide hydrolase
MSPLVDSGSVRSPASGLASGQTVGGGRYLLKRVLGQGGMAVVWLADDKLLREPVALKFLPPQFCFDPAGMEGLRRETLRTRRLTHPNIIRIHDLHDLPDEPVFISMEYVDGSNAHVLRADSQGKVLSWEFLAPLFRQLVSALDYAHGENIIHRDLKPANLLVDRNGRLKLSDFGLAGIVTDSMSRLSDTRTSGTIGYMSPQQADGRKPRASDDIYALGVTLYELLTSTPPFYSGDIGYQVRQVTPEPMEQRLADLGLSNGIPAEVGAMVMACLAKEPEQRPQSAKAVLELIEPSGSPGVEVQPSIQKSHLKRRLLEYGWTLVLAAGVFSTVAYFVLKPASHGFKEIFNGRNLGGWEGDPGLWSVKDGAISASSAAEGVTRRENTCLIWREAVGDFELRLQFRALDVIRDKPANSGVLYRSRRVPNPEHNWQVRGYQADLHGDFTGTLLLLEDTLRDLRSEWGHSVLLRRSKDGVTMKSSGRTTQQQIKNIVKPGAWNELVIVAKGNHLIHKINGVVTLEAIDETAASASGCLALEMKRATQIQFKDIRLRRL